VNITISERDLAGRQTTIRALLKPLVASPAGIACVRQNLVQGVILAAHDGPRPRTAYRDWQFKTRNQTLRAQYFEEWRELNGGKSYWLRQLSLHLYEIKPADPFTAPQELLAVHAEPSLSDGGTEYKRGPHLHISESSRFRHAHIPLCDGFNKIVLGSIQDLTDAFRRIAKMMHTELLT